MCMYVYVQCIYILLCNALCSKHVCVERSALTPKPWTLETLNRQMVMSQNAPFRSPRIRRNPHLCFHPSSLLSRLVTTKIMSETATTSPNMENKSFSLGAPRCRIWGLGFGA